jgi:hypothetical protein
MSGQERDDRKTAERDWLFLTDPAPASDVQRQTLSDAAAEWFQVGAEWATEQGDRRMVELCHRGRRRSGAAIGRRPRRRWSS